MQTKFYSGNYSLSLGQPYVIISSWEDEKNLYCETYIIFEGYNGNNYGKKSRIKYPKFDGSTLTDFVEAELQKIKDKIFYDILLVHYKQQLEVKNYNVQINLREVNESILMLLRDKFLHLISLIQDDTKNELLSSKIRLYRSIQVERTDDDME